MSCVHLGGVCAHSRAHARPGHLHPVLGWMSGTLVNPGWLYPSVSPSPGPLSACGNFRIFSALITAPTAVFITLETQRHRHTHATHTRALHTHTWRLHTS